MHCHDASCSPASRRPQKLRAGLKAELGALYPLLLLKPIETMAGPEGAHAVTMAAEGLLHTCGHPQVQRAGGAPGMRLGA